MIKRAPDGATWDEVHNRTRIPLDTVSPRFAELVEMGFITVRRDADGAEITRTALWSPQQQTVWFDALPHLSEDQSLAEYRAPSHKPSPTLKRFIAKEIARAHRLNRMLKGIKIGLKRPLDKDGETYRQIYDLLLDPRLERSPILTDWIEAFLEAPSQLLADEIMAIYRSLPK